MRVLVLTLGLLLIPSETALSAEEPSPPKAKEIAAKVNGKPIYQEQLKPDVERGLARFRKYGMRKDDPALVKRLRMRTLDRIVGEELMRQESQKLTVKDIDKKVQQRLKTFEGKHGRGGGIEEYLKMRSLTMEDLKESARARVYLDEYLKEQGISEPEIPEDRVREAYQRNPESYSRKETLKASHILIAVDPKAGAEEKKQARQEAEQIRGEILEGKDFAEMAKKHSDCNSASGGGHLRSIKRGYMPKEFERVAFALEKNAVSEVVETKFGYHIIKVFRKTPAGVVPYGEVKDFITKFLQQEESKKKLAAHMDELKKKAKIEVLLAE